MAGFVLTSIVAMAYWIAAMFERYENDSWTQISSRFSPFTESIYAKRVSRKGK